MGILQDKNILITGVLTDASLAFGVAQLAISEGANVVVTGAGRGLRLTERTVRKSKNYLIFRIFFKTKFNMPSAL